MADDREQIVFQLRALAVVDKQLRAQLDAGDYLPVLRWSVQDAGSKVYGECFAEHREDRRRAVEVWAGRLGLQTREVPLAFGEVRLTASGKAEQVDVIVTAYLLADEEGEERG